MVPLSAMEAFELGYELRSFAFSSHCYDTRDLGRFWALDPTLWSTPNLADTVRLLGAKYDELGVWPKTKFVGLEAALRVIREYLKGGA